MGYRFTLESANTVANLTFGKVMSCYRDIYSSEESYDNFMLFLDQFHQNIYSNQNERYMKSIRRIREVLHRYEHYKRPIDDVLYDDSFTFFHRDALEGLHELSDIFGRCSIKSLLLPKMYGSNTFDDDFMISEKLLHELIHIHAGDSCLILQPQERPCNVTIFDAFPNFDVALRQADAWPAVLFWDGVEDYAFVPIKHKDELRYLYEIARYEKHPIGEIKRVAEKKKRISHYIFQLSDLHFGAKNVDVAERRLKSLIKTQLASIELDDDISFVITGDAVDSPSEVMENDYFDFAEYLEEKCGKKPIRVLGNHDINNHGLAFSHGKQHIANIVGEYPKIEILEEAKTILLLFNSNTNGSFASGEIGVTQMSEMGNLLDNVNNLNQYMLIAVMHHHLLPIPQPNYYDEKWYKKIIPNGLLDETLRLRDADIFMEWLIQRNVRCVLHGHKHIPFITEKNGVKVIACGSSTGKIVHKEKGKTFISYNLVKICKREIICTQFAEEIQGAGAKNIRTEIIRL